MQSPSWPKKQPPSLPNQGSVKQMPGPPRKLSRRKKVATRRGDVQPDEDMMTMATVEETEGQPKVKRQKKPSEISMENFANSLAKKKIEGLRAEFRELQSFVPQDTASVAFVINKAKNRYYNVVCYDRTRVILTYNVPPDSDYINANWVQSSFCGLTNKYICTQGPIDLSVADFWRLIWQEKVKNIVMLCGVIENGKPKCAQYYPTNMGESKVWGSLMVTNKRNVTLPSEKIYESTLFEVCAEGFVEPLQVTLMRWLDWPDFGIPQSGMGMLRIMKSIRDNIDSTAVIHCSAGIGRTGTIMACEICLRIMLEGKELNVPEVVKKIRSQRAGAIQTESQYVYLHRALSEYIHAKKLVKNELAKFFSAYAEYRKSLLAENPTAVNNPK